MNVKDAGQKSESCPELEEPPLKKRRLSPSARERNRDENRESDTDTESDIGILFSVRSSSSSGLTSPERRASFCSEGFEPSQGELDDMISMDPDGRSAHCGDDVSESAASASTADEEDGDVAGEDEVTNEDAHSASSEGFLPAEAHSSLDGGKNAETKCAYEKQQQCAEGLDNRSYISDKLEVKNLEKS